MSWSYDDKGYTHSHRPTPKNDNFRIRRFPKHAIPSKIQLKKFDSPLQKTLPLPYKRK